MCVWKEPNGQADTCENKEIVSPKKPKGRVLPLIKPPQSAVPGGSDPRADSLTRSQINYIFNLFTRLRFLPPGSVSIRTIVCESCLSMELPGFVGKLFLLPMIDIR